MEKQLRMKILAVLEDLHKTPNGILSASEFDHQNLRSQILKDPRGSRWNRYVHKNSVSNGFDIIKSHGRNTYVLITGKN